VPRQKHLRFKIAHTYITNCSLLFHVQDYFFLIALGYTLIICLWIVSVWFLYEEHTLTLQKALLIIPIFKLLRVVIYGMYIGECPWPD